VCAKPLWPTAVIHYCNSRDRRSKFFIFPNFHILEMMYTKQYYLQIRRWGVPPYLLLEINWDELGAIIATKIPSSSYINFPGQRRLRAATAVSRAATTIYLWSTRVLVRVIWRTTESCCCCCGCCCCDGLINIQNMAQVATFTPMVERQEGVSCCTARGFPYLHIRGCSREVCGPWEGVLA